MATTGSAPARDSRTPIESLAAAVLAATSLTNLPNEQQEELISNERQVFKLLFESGHAAQADSFTRFVDQRKRVRRSMQALRMISTASLSETKIALQNQLSRTLEHCPSTAAEWKIEDINVRLEAVNRLLESRSD
ncbi:MAG TPA: hypothetical protein VMT99_00945 [Candidatus Paceibacterota bacterium]|nr:hypothetical protein [Candidatus Paceibacterota bacterium]